MKLSPKDRVAEEIVRYFCAHGVHINGLHYSVKITSRIPDWERVLGKKEVQSGLAKDDFAFGGIELRLQKILIHPRSRGMSRLVVLLHEFIHGIDIRLSEDTVDKIAQFFASTVIDSVILGYSKETVVSMLMKNIALPPDDWNTGVSTK